MGWFYGFKLHIICNTFMQILKFRLTAGNIDDRKALDRMWNTIFGLIIADAGYLGKNWQKKSISLGKPLFTAVKANMKKLMTRVQHQLLKIRQKAETVFSVLKVRLGLETSLPRSPLGHFAHYMWCITAYQVDQYFNFMFRGIGFHSFNPI
jgi:transposase